MLCDGCGSGCHFYCGPAPFSQLPAEADFWLCIFCARFGDSFHPTSGRPAPAPVPAVHALIDAAVAASYASSTIAYDDVVFNDFIQWYVVTYGFAVSSHVDFFNSDLCFRHRSEATSGYVAQLESSSTARIRAPTAVVQALRRAFLLQNLRVDTMGTGTLTSHVVRGSRLLAGVTNHTRKLGVSHEMLILAHVDAANRGTSHELMLARMHGLASIFAYSVGARVSEFACTRAKTRDGSYELNKHTLLNNMATFFPSVGVPLSLEILPLSTKSTSSSNPRARNRPRPIVLVASVQSGGLSEVALSSFLVGALLRWKEDARSSPEDPIFSLRHLVHDRSYRTCCTRQSVSEYVKALARKVGLPTDNFSSKSFKISRVSHGVLRGEGEQLLLERGNHLATGSSRHYRPHAAFFGNVPVPPSGVSSDFILGEARREDALRRRHRSASSSEDDSD